MQITLNQAEIEQAIKNYVNDQVNIREGHDITIDLKAGRGPEGFTATIDIVAPGATKATEPTGTNKPTLTPTTPKPRAERAVTQPADTKGLPTPDAPEPEGQETAQEAAEETAPETATDAQSEGQTAQEEAAAADPGEGEGKKPQSLFANLGKPRN